MHKRDFDLTVYQAESEKWKAPYGDIFQFKQSILHVCISFFVKYTKVTALSTIYPEGEKQKLLNLIFTHIVRVYYCVCQHITCSVSLQSAMLNLFRMNIYYILIVLLFFPFGFTSEKWSAMLLFCDLRELKNNCSRLSKHYARGVYGWWGVFNLIILTTQMKS